MREPVGGTDRTRHVHPDALRVALGDELAQVRTAEQVVGAVSFQQVAVDAERGALDPVAAAIGENVVSDVSYVASAEVLEQRVVQSLPDHGDPHVDTVLPHRIGQNMVELITANLRHALPAAPRFLRECRVESAQGKQRETDEKAQRSTHEARLLCLKPT